MKIESNTVEITDKSPHCAVCCMLATFYLSVYLHNLVMKKWDAEANNYQIEFEIQAIRTEPEIICFQ
jgi:hypothetical protein